MAKVGCLIFLCPMKVTFDLDYIIRVASVFLSSIAQKQDDAPAGQATSAVDTNETLTYSSRGTKIVSLTYLRNFDQIKSSIIGQACW